VTFTRGDAYRTVTSVLMVALGVVILARTLPLGVHLQALLVGVGFVGLGAYRLAFVVGYLRARDRHKAG
jgi:NADH:ubiquinone oxidoreductase subunit 5 (subunit L)/multisubunit Na+/H+ antiporter MnhA subunit